ncbi:MAG TPA: hypothetical protein PLF42_06425 [Anaerolineales bacterium]|nr:hypothetical protein [Anaerolineales bacterium]
MKQLLQHIKDGKTVIEEVPIPTPREGQALVKVAASLVSAGTERMVVEFAEKSLVGKARSRPDLVKQVLDKAKVSFPPCKPPSTASTSRWRLATPLREPSSRSEKICRASRSVSAWRARAAVMPRTPNITLCRKIF